MKTKVKTWVVNIARNFLIMPRKIATDGLKTTSKWAVQETEATGDLIGNKIVNKTTKL